MLSLILMRTHSPGRRGDAFAVIEQEGLNRERCLSRVEDGAGCMYGVRHIGLRRLGFNVMFQYPARTASHEVLDMWRRRVEP